MNYILTIPFLILLFSFYVEVGAFILKLCRYQDITLSKKVLGGFLFTFFLSFIVGVPLQYIHVSWNIFMIFYSITLVLVIAIILKFNRKEMISRWKRLLTSPISVLGGILKENYLIFGLIGMFVVLSMSNALAYYQMNYDDSYYIGKIVNLIGSSGLLNENYFNGALYEGFEGGISRLFNTYEITYGYFASLFHISVPFFCRCTMTIHNYLITFIAYKALASYFVSKKNAQYVLSIFAIFLISAGFMYNSANAPFKIRMYDAWQFQTAMFYGGSLVRMTAIPSILVFGKELFEKLDYRKIIFMAIIYMAYVSFSTIFFPYAVFLTFGFIFLKCMDLALDDHRIIGISGIVLCIVMLVLATKLEGTSLTTSETYLENYQEYQEFCTHYFNKDTIYLWMPFLLPIGLLCSKERSAKMLSGTVLIMYVIFFSGVFDALIMLSTVNYMFVAMRVWTSMQYFAVFSLGLGVVYLLENMKLHRIIIILLSYAMVAYPVVVIKTHLGDILQENFTGSGISERGYDLGQLTYNDEMMPEIMVQVGNYFNSLPYGNYRLLVNDEIPYNGTYISGYGFVATSNRIEIYCHGGLNDMVRAQYVELLAYLKNEKSLSEVQYLIDEHEIQYILVTDENQKNELVDHGYQVVLASRENPYWLIQTVYA